MSKITEEMILECYEAFRRNERKYVPQGMDASSASMSMLWLDSLFTGKPYHRDGSALQYELVLNRIKEDYGEKELLKAIAVLREHCEWSLKHHNKPHKKHRAVLNSFDMMPTADSVELEKNVTALLSIPNLDKPKGVAKPAKVVTTQTTEVIERDPKVKAWIIQNAGGLCEYCQEPAFFKEDGLGYLEVHHLRPLAEGGSDTIHNTVAICANCHRKLHFARNKVKMRQDLIERFFNRLINEYP
jgi:5-methylcytosine-specific restriction endonuclease McrA